MIAAGVVLTGGSAKMEGAIELAEEVFHMPVRLGVPQWVSGLSDVVRNPIHATGVGLLLYGGQPAAGSGVAGGRRAIRNVWAAHEGVVPGQFLAGVRGSQRGVQGQHLYRGERTMFELMDAYSQNAVIKVIGVGGGGGNAVAHMMNSGIDGVEFICANTDAQALKQAKVKTALQIGCNITKGLGAGANPDVGRQAAMEDRDRIQE
jgi:cell division ATPase FtsA